MSQRELLEQQKKSLEPEARASREIVQAAKAAGRGLTTEERGVVDAYLKAAKALNDGLDCIARDDAIWAQAKALGAELGNPYSTESSVKDDGRRLSFKGMGSRVARTVLGGRMGEKAVAPTGASTVGQEFTSDPVQLGQPATGLLDVLPVTTHATPQFAYLRQNVRTNSATAVAEGATKPTSVYSVVKVEDQLAVVAHLSEALPRFWISDNASLEQWLTNELTYGLSVAVEAMALATIAAASNVQTQAYATSPLVTLRKSVSKLEVSGYDPAAFVLHPLDWEATETLLLTGTAVEYRGLPYDPVTRRLFGVPVVVTNAATEGVAHTLAQGAAGVDTDSQGVQIAWSETSNSTDWSENMIRARCEGRYAASVFRPLGVVQSDLTAA